MSQVQFHYSRTTERTIPDAIAALEAALAKRKFSVLWHLDMAAKLKEKGQETDRVFHVFEVCSAPHAKRALETNLEVGFFLPCKMAIYEKDGQTHVGLLSPHLLIELLGEHRLQDLADQVGRDLTAAVDEVAGD